MPQATLDPRMPPRDGCVQRLMIERWAREAPARTFAVFEDGTEWTWADTRAEAAAAGDALARLGLAQDDRLLVWLPNGAEILRTWFGAGWLGAVYTPINTAYRGRLLEHAVALSGARLAVIHADLLPRLRDVDLGPLRDVVVVGASTPPEPIPGLALHGAAALAGDPDALREPARPLMPWDAQQIMFTSGTTGPSKGVLSSYLHMQQQGAAAPYLGAEDRYLVNLPMFHCGGLYPISAMLHHGGAIAVVSGFRTETFWPTVRRLGATSSIILGAMAGFLLKQPDAPDDRDHPLRTASFVPLDDGARAFRERFGVQAHTLFNMTEIAMPLVSRPDPDRPGEAGRVRPGFELRVVDANDCELPDGQPGELVVRADCPWAMSSGYVDAPDATAKAWRNGWFHTGDSMRREPDGTFFFVDRIKDAIRRRGENISSFEVEAELLAHPAVREAAAVAVAGASEDEVLAVLSLRPGAELDPAELIEFLRPRLAHFMIPRFVRVMDELPKTPTSKIEKHVLRAEGLTAGAWDREAAGIRVRAEKVGP